LGIIDIYIFCRRGLYCSAYGLDRIAPRLSSANAAVATGIKICKLSLTHDKSDWRTRCAHSGIGGAVFRESQVRIKVDKGKPILKTHPL
jgi:hypothetical protein